MISMVYPQDSRCAACRPRGNVHPTETALQFRGEGQERDVLRPLDRHGEPALMPGASARHTARKNFAALLNERLEHVSLFVINQVHLLDAESADLLFAQELALAAAVRARRTSTLRTARRRGGRRRCGGLRYGMFFSHLKFSLSVGRGGLFGAGGGRGFLRAARGAAFAAAAQLFLALHFLIEANRQVLDHSVRNAQAPLEFLEQLSVAGTQDHVHVKAFAQFLHAIGEATRAPLFHFFHFRVLFLHGVLQRGDDFIDLRFRRVRPEDEDQIVQSFFHVSSFPSRTHETDSPASSSGAALRLNFDIARFAPSVNIASTASAALAIIASAALRTSLPMGARS